MENKHPVPCYYCGHATGRTFVSPLVPSVRGAQSNHGSPRVECVEGACRSKSDAMTSDPVTGVHQPQKGQSSVHQSAIYSSVITIINNREQEDSFSVTHSSTLDRKRLSPEDTSGALEFIASKYLGHNPWGKHNFASLGCLSLLPRAPTRNKQTVLLPRPHDDHRPNHFKASFLLSVAERNCVVQNLDNFTHRKQPLVCLCNYKSCIPIDLSEKDSSVLTKQPQLLLCLVVGRKARKTNRAFPSSLVSQPRFAS